MSNMNDPTATNITWSHAKVSEAERARLKGHPGFVLWLTGLSASGKSTLAQELDLELHRRRCHSYILDGDNIRYGLNRDLGFSPEDRDENVRRIGEVARLFSNAGVIAITAFISPYRGVREAVRERHEAGRFVEVWVKCSLDECRRRDPKGLYERAAAGTLKEFTGISAPYEEPQNPELVVDTERNDLAACVDQVLGYLAERRLIGDTGSDG